MIPAKERDDASETRVVGVDAPVGASSEEGDILQVTGEVHTLVEDAVDPDRAVGVFPVKDDMASDVKA